MRQLLRRILRISCAAQTDVGLQIVVSLEHHGFRNIILALAREVGHFLLFLVSGLTEDSENRIQPAEGAALIDAEIGRSLNGVLNRRIRPEGVLASPSLPLNVLYTR